MLTNGDESAGTRLVTRRIKAAFSRLATSKRAHNELCSDSPGKSSSEGKRENGKQERWLGNSGEKNLHGVVGSR